MIFLFLSNEKYRKVRNTTMIVYELLHARHQISKKSTNKGSKDFIDKHGVFCYYPQKELAKDIGVSVRTIRYSFRILREAGLIDVIERGCQRVAKIYVYDPVADDEDKNGWIRANVDDEEVREVFEEIFKSKPNVKEALGLNKLIKKYDINILIEAIKKSFAVKHVKARISYITKVADSLIEQQTKPLKSTKKRVIRYEIVPDWLKNKDYENNSENKQFSREDCEKIERMKQLQSQILGGKIKTTNSFNY